MKKPISSVEFIRCVIKKSELGKPFKLMPFQEAILNLTFAFDDDGRLSHDTVIYSCPKKSGKTTLNAALICGGPARENAFIRICPST